MVMAVAAVFSLICGIIWGQVVGAGELSSFFASSGTPILCVVMFFAGMSVGANRAVFAKMKEYHVKVMVIPLGIIIASIIAGAACAPLFHMPINYGMTITASLGWYSLSGIMITELGSAEIGTIAFISSLLREILSFFFIPLLAKYLSPYAAIAPAGATSSDSTLPSILKYCGGEAAIMAAFSGVLCSASVPILLPFLFALY